MKKLFYFLLFLLFAAQAEAATYWVGKDSSPPGPHCNNSTTDPGAFGHSLTIAQAIQCAINSGAPGSTVVITAGSYDERFASGFIPNGTAGNYFTITNKPGDTVTIKPLTLGGGFACIICLETTGDWVWIKAATPNSLIIDGTNQRANSITIGRQNVQISGIEFTNSNGVNTIFISNSNNLISGNKIHGGSHSVPPDLGYPIYVEGDSNTIDGNEIYDFPRYGIHINHSGGSVSNTIIRNNRIHNGVTLLSASESAIVCATNCATGNKIYNNVIYAMSQGHGIVVSGNGTAVYNNTVVGSPQKGIYVYPTNSSGIVVVNNISYQNGTGDMLDEGSSTVWAKNWCGSVSLPTCEFGGNPLFISQASANFNLQAGSPAINIGTPNISPFINIPVCSGSTTLNCYNGTAPDLGALETGVPTAGGGPPTLTVNLTNVQPGGTIQVTVDDDDVNQRAELTGDSVNLLPSGSANYDQSPIDYFFMNGTKTAPSVPISNAVLTFTAPSTVGAYDFVFYPEGATQANQYLATATFNVVAPGIVMKFNVSSLKIGPSVTWKIGTP